MRLLVLASALIVGGCAQRYLRVTAAGDLDCQSELTVKERKDGHHVSGCGRETVCNRVWWSGADEWSCETSSDGGAP